MTSKGYTFFELLMVLAIIVIITSMVSVNVSSIFGSNNVTAIAKEISVDLYYAQQKAIEESTNWTVEFSEAGYKIYPFNEQSNPRVEKNISSSNITFGDIDGNYSPVNSTLTYNSFGAPIGGSVTTFAIKNSKNTTLYLKLTPVTGKLDIVNNITE